MSWKEERGRDPRAADPVMVEDHEPTNGRLSLSLSGRDKLFINERFFSPKFTLSSKLPSLSQSSFRGPHA